MNAKDSQFIKEAVHMFHDPGVFAKSLGYLSGVVERKLKWLPNTVQTKVAVASTTAIEKCLKWSISSISESSNLQLTVQQGSSRAQKMGWLHTVAAGVSGGVSGFWGLPALVVELPFVTTVMMRSIAQIAQSYGYDIKDPAIQVECLLVFAHGGPTKADDDMETGYFSTKLAFGALSREAAQLISGLSAKDLVHAIDSKSIPILARLVAEIADVFGVRVSEKFMAQMTPLVGALGGAGINVIFTNYFSQIARFHFGLKRLEEIYGEEEVKSVYDRALAGLEASRR